MGFAGVMFCTFGGFAAADSLPGFWFALYIVFAADAATDATSGIEEVDDDVWDFATVSEPGLKDSYGLTAG